MSNKTKPKVSKAKLKRLEKQAAILLEDTEYYFKVAVENECINSVCKIDQKS